MNEQSTSAPVPADQYVLTLSCPDRKGIVHAVSSYLFMTGCNIEDSQQFGDHDTGLFFMRVHFSADAPVTVEKLRASFAAIGDSFQMDWQINRADQKMRILLMVSKFGHCGPGRCRWRSPEWCRTIRTSPSWWGRTTSPSTTFR
jgi:formyltetrahydrofolate deformylase